MPAVGSSKRSSFGSSPSATADVQKLLVTVGQLKGMPVGLPFKTEAFQNGVSLVRGFLEPRDGLRLSGSD